MNDYNNVLVGFSELIKNEEFRPYEGDLRLGVDLGTANIVGSSMTLTTSSPTDSTTLEITFTFPEIIPGGMAVAAS